MAGDFSKWQISLCMQVQNNRHGQLLECDREQHEQRQERQLQQWQREQQQQEQQ
jgi:hypothetical protein